jgi:hypothetical protein
MKMTFQEIRIIPITGDQNFEMRKEPGSVNDKWNISVVICDIDIP